MPDQSTRKLPSQSDGQTKTNPFLDFQIPTLADLLKRLSIISATPASKVPREPVAYHEIQARLSSRLRKNG